MLLKKLTLAISIATGSALAHAEASPVQTLKNEKNSAENSVNNSANTTLSGVTVSASPIHDHDIFEVPSQINRLADREKMMQDSGSLGAALESMPGVNNMSTGTQSGKPVVRGLTGNRVKVLSNGQGTDDQAYGARHMPNTDSYLADSIEVIRGPQSVLYGSEALGGVVNVIQAPMPYGQDAKGEIATEYNSNNQEKMLGAKVGVGSDKFAITAGVVKREADNFTVPNASRADNTAPGSGANSRPLFVGEVPFTNFENQSGNIGVGYQDDWGLVELRYTQWESKQNYVGVVPEAGKFVAQATGQTLQNDETQLRAELELGGDWLLKPTWTRIRNSREASHDLSYEKMSADKGTDHYLDLVVKRDDVRLALEHPKFGDFEGELGLEWSEKTQDLRSGHLTPSADESKRAVYLFEEADYDQWLLQFGVRYDWHSVKAPLDGNNTHFVETDVFNASNNTRDFEVLSGSLGAVYRLDSQWSLAGNIARGFRAPTIFELYAGGEHGGVQAYQQGNPNLKEETALNTDLSLRWKSDKTQMVATVYQNLIDNYIYLTNTGKERISEGQPDEGKIYDPALHAGQKHNPEMKAQQTDATIHGIEFSLQHQFTQAWSTDLALELIEGRDTKNSQVLPLMPANNLRVNLHYQPQDFAGLQQQRWSLGVKMVDSKNAAGEYEPFSQFDDKPFGTASTDAYAVWNLGYQAEVKLDRQTLLVGARVDNLFDSEQVDFLNTYKGVTLNTGRNIQLSARLNF